MKIPEKVLVLGAGPIIIGQGCEFDYSGTQVCKRLKKSGYKVILINPNPATVMTDYDVADRTYIEPLSVESVIAVIERERPDAILPIAGGQTALNLALAIESELASRGIIWMGVDSQAIRNAEDRRRFRDLISKIGLSCVRSAIVVDQVTAENAVEEIGLPVIIRPSFTLGGLGGGIAYNGIEYKRLITDALRLSSQIQVDQSLIGWKEYEVEVVLDCEGNGLIVCAIENVDPVGVHTGDSVTVSPVMTLTDKEYQKMRDAALAIVKAVGIRGSGANVQFAVNPLTGEQLVIEMNPRVSRSSTLASKATGFPIATISAAMATGSSLANIRNECTGSIPASFEPSLDYVVVKMPRFDFDKFDAPKVLSTAMRSVGEAMAIGANFMQAMQKALCSLECGYDGLAPSVAALNRDALHDCLSKLAPDKVLHIADALRAGIGVEEICSLTFYDRWYVEQIQGILSVEALLVSGTELTKETMLRAKKSGLSDSRIARLIGSSWHDVMRHRHALGIRPVFKRVDTCAGEFKAMVSYMYSCYVGDYLSPPVCESRPSERDKIVILGNGCTRIGQGIEFDYACVHASKAARDMGIETIMINSNPSTVSTDYDVSDRLYFEPMTCEHVLEVLEAESKRGRIIGVIVQMGGQTPLKLARAISEAGYNILGTSIDAIDLAEDREKFRELLRGLSLQGPIGKIAMCEQDVAGIVADLGYPILLRPSYVLGGEAMEVINDEDELQSYLARNRYIFANGPLLADHFLTDSVEVDVEALCDGSVAVVVGVMEHIEAAGVHSGDSACSIPTRSISPALLATLVQQTETLALALGIVGLLNVQFAIKDQVPYILEANPRASRTVPFVTKVTGVPIAQLATRIICGEKLDRDSLLGSVRLNDFFAVKMPVFPFNKFNEAETILGPQMRSTGETMAFGRTFGEAFAKAYSAAGNKLPQSGRAFISVSDKDKTQETLDIARGLGELGFSICATEGTAAFLGTAGIPVEVINKARQGRPHILDFLIDGKISLVVNTTEGRQSIRDSHSIRRTALTNAVPCITTISGALAILAAIRSIRDNDGFSVVALQDVYAPL